MWPTKSEHQQQPLDLASATVQAAALPEVVSQRRRVYCLTLSTAPDRPGEPTLWSASVDALAGGTDSTRDGDQIQLLSEPDFDQARLILVAAGNVAPPYIDDHRTEERRVGKEWVSTCSARWSPDNQQKKKRN